MDISIWDLLILVIAGAGITLTGVLLGGYIMFRGRSDSPVFLGTQPKGGAYSIKDGLDDGVEFPAEPGANEKHVLDRATNFLKNLGA